MVNVVDLHEARARHRAARTGLSDTDFDSLFTKDKPIIFAFHGYPWLIHRLTYRRTTNRNLHVRGYKEEGTITTAFDMTVMNDMDRFHLVMDAIDRLPQTGTKGAYLKQELATSSSSTSATSTNTARTCPKSTTGNGPCRPRHHCRSLTKGRAGGG